MKNPSRSWIFCVPVGMHTENADHGHERIRHYVRENKKTGLLKHLIYFVLCISPYISCYS